MAVAMEYSVELGATSLISRGDCKLQLPNSRDLYLADWGMGMKTI